MAQKTLTSGVTNPLTQVVMARFLASAAYERHLRTYRRRLEKLVLQMSDAVLQSFPAGTRRSQPQGGLVLWVELPDGRDGNLLHQQAIAAGIAFVPGEMFSASGQYRNCLRLNCGNPWTPRIEQAVRQLGKLAGDLPTA